MYHVYFVSNAIYAKHKVGEQVTLKQAQALLSVLFISTLEIDIILLKYDDFGFTYMYKGQTFFTYIEGEGCNYIPFSYLAERKTSDEPS